MTRKMLLFQMIILMINIISSLETICEGNLVWTDCALCEPTCLEPDPICTSECKSKCVCPTHLPILLLDGKSCGNLIDCKDDTNPRENKCNTYDGKKLCLADPNCQWRRNRQACFKRKNQNDET